MGKSISVSANQKAHFRVLLCLFFKTSLSAKPFMWKWLLHAVSFSWKSVIFIRMVSHLDSLWNRGTRELGNGLFMNLVVPSPCEIKPWNKIYYESRKLNLRSKTTTDNTNWAVSVYGEKLYFCKNAQTMPTYSVVTLACSVATAPVTSAKWTSTISYHRSPDE